MLAVFDVLCDCSLLIAEMIGFGPSANPARQPVIAYVFDSDPSTSTCSLHSVQEAPETAAPEGFDGVFRMIALVFGVIAASIIFAVTRKFSASDVCTNTAVPPAN